MNEEKTVEYASIPENEVSEEEDLNNELEKNDYMEKSNKMLKNMKDELRRSKTIYVNPYRSKRNINSKRLERLRNIKIKRRQNSQGDFY